MILKETENLKSHELFGDVLFVLKNNQGFITPSGYELLEHQAGLIMNNIKMQLEGLKWCCSGQLTRALELKCRGQYGEEYISMKEDGLAREMNINVLSEVLQRLFLFYCKAQEVDVPEHLC